MLKGQLLLQQRIDLVVLISLNIKPTLNPNGTVLSMCRLFEWSLNFLFMTLTYSLVKVK